MRTDPATTDQITARLARAGCVAAADEAAELTFAAPTPAVLETWLRRREVGEPLAWIVGQVRFCGHALFVHPGVYVPRFQTEDLARRAASLLPARGRALDLCTGAGAVAVHLQRAVPSAAVIGVERDRVAARCARRNGVAVVVDDLGDSLRAIGMFDVVTAVAPYVPTGALCLLPPDTLRYEPRSALDGGSDGLDVVRRVVARAGDVLRPGGWLLVELGGDQDDLVAPLLRSAGFVEVETHRDSDGDLRSMTGRTAGPRKRLRNASLWPGDPLW